MEKVTCERELPTALLMNFYNASELRPGTAPSRSRATMECVKSAKALHFIYELDDRSELQQKNLAWMNLMYNTMSDNRHFNGLLVGANAFRSRDDELRRSTSESQDIIFVIFTFIIIISYTAGINFSCDLYKNRAISALFGSVSTILGIVAGFGYTSLCGVAFVPTALVTPFLVMGVGCDDVFVLINSYALAFLEPGPRERCITTFKDCGVSVILTTLTNLIAFGIGCQSPYLSIRNFCLFSLSGLAFSLFFELTIFYAALCVDAKREAERRTCCCALNQTEEEIEEVTETKRVASVVSGLFGDRSLSTFELVNYQVGKDWDNRPGFLALTDIKQRKDGEKKSLLTRFWSSFVVRGNHLFGIQTLSSSQIINSDGVSNFMRQNTVMLASQHPAFTREPAGNVGRRWRKFFSNTYCPRLLNPKMKLAVIGLFAGIFAMALRGISHIESGLELKDLSPDHSYLKIYDGLYAKFFNEFDIPVYVFFPDSSTPWWDPRAIRTLRVLDAKLKAQKSTRFMNDPLIRMLEDRELASSMQSGNRFTFENALYDAVTTPGSKYKQFEKDFVWEGRRLVAWKVTLLPSGMATSQERATWMRRIRQDVSLMHSLDDEEFIESGRSIGAFYPLKAVAWNYMMVFYESDLHMTTSLISSMTTAMIAMFVVALILIPEITSGIIVIIIMTLIDVAVTGFMYYWDVRLHMISMITLVISIGFSIDYSAHICHTFTHCLGRTRNLRAVECIVLMGTPVFHGAASTIAGIMILGNSQSFIFRLFFKMLTLTLLFGIAHGLILLPVILSLFGKMPSSANVKDGVKHSQLALKPSTTAADPVWSPADDSENYFLPSNRGRNGSQMRQSVKISSSSRGVIGPPQSASDSAQFSQYTRNPTTSENWWIGRYQRDNSPTLIQLPWHSRERSSAFPSSNIFVNDPTPNVKPVVEPPQYFPTSHLSELKSLSADRRPRLDAPSRPDTAASYHTAIPTARLITEPQTCHARLFSSEERFKYDLASAVLSSLQLAREIEGRWGSNTARTPKATFQGDRMLSAPATPSVAHMRECRSVVSEAPLERCASPIVSHGRRPRVVITEGLANPDTPRLIAPRENNRVIPDFHSTLLATKKQNYRVK